MPSATFSSAREAQDGAAAGGIGLATLRVKRGRAPLALIAVHALIALSGVAVAFIEALGGGGGAPPPYP